MSDGNGFDPSRPRETDGRFAEYKAPAAAGSLTVPADPGSVDGSAQADDGMSDGEREQATSIYAETLFWVNDDSLRDAGYDGDGSAADLSPEDRGRAEAEVSHFIAHNRALVDAAIASGKYRDTSEVAYDFALTRNGEGAGFWDRGLDDELGEALSERARAYGEQTLELGDDGALHLASRTDLNDLDRKDCA